MIIFHQANIKQILRYQAYPHQSNEKNLAYSIQKYLFLRFLLLVPTPHLFCSSLDPENPKAVVGENWQYVHLPALLYGWFWFGLFLCGLLAPPERVVLLESTWVTQGWHLSAMTCIFGIPILGLYSWRMRPPIR